MLCCLQQHERNRPRPSKVAYEITRPMKMLPALRTGRTATGTRLAWCRLAGGGPPGRRTRSTHDRPRPANNGNLRRPPGDSRAGSIERSDGNNRPGMATIRRPSTGMRRRGRQTAGESGADDEADRDERFHGVWDALLARSAGDCIQKTIRAHFIRSKFFCKICQSARPPTFARLSAMSFASFAFFVGRFTL